MKKLKFGILSILLFGIIFFTNGINVNAKTVIINEPSEWKTTVEDTTIDEIKLGKNIDLTTAIEGQVLPSLDVSSDATTRTFDLNGYELQVSTDALNVYFKVSEATIIIKDSSESKTGKIVHTSTDSALINVAYASADYKGNLIIEGGTYIGHNNESSEYGVIFNQGTTYLTINSGIFDSRSLVSGTRPFLAINEMVLFNSSATSNTTAASIIKEDTGRLTFGDIIDSNHSAYVRQADGTENKISSMLLATTTVTSLDSYAAYTDSIVVKENKGLQASDIYFKNVYDYADISQSILIQNKSLTPLTVKNITLDNYDSFTIDGPNEAIIEPGSTNAAWTIKVKEGLSVGTHSAILTITDENGRTYIAHIIIDVTKKKITDLGIGFTEKLYYGENDNIEPTINGIEGLTSDDYKIEYTKTGTEEWSTKRPTLVGNYNIRITIINPNYEEVTASSEFEILQTEKVVKIVGSSSSHVYNGKPYSDNGYTVYFDGKETKDRTLFYDDTVSTILVTGTVKDVKDNKANNNIVDRDALTITNRDCYKNIEIVDGTISIEPIAIPLVVTAKSTSRAFNNTTLVNTDFTYSDNVLLEGEKVIVAVEGSQFYVGSSDNKVIDVQVLRDNTNITSNYTISKVNGTLTVESAPQEMNANTNITVKVGAKLTVAEIKEYLGENASSYQIKMKSATHATFDETNGFAAGDEIELVTMEAISPAIDLNNDGQVEYKEATSEFYISVKDKDVVKLSGLTYTDKYYDKKEIEPTGTLIVENDLVPIDTIEVLYKGTGNTEYESSKAPVNAGTYEVTYKVPNNNPTYAGSVSYTFTIKKAQVEIPSEDASKFVYNKKSQNISITYDNSLINVTGATSETNAGDYSYTLALKDKDNYEWKDGTTTDIVRSWKIEKATPEYTIPTELTGIKGQTLLEISLAGRFTWNNPNEKLSAGTHAYKATYTPEDTENYKTLNDIDISITAKDIFTITGTVIEGKGTIDVPTSEIVEGSLIEVTFTPETGYMLAKVSVNGTEVEVTDNKLKLTVDANQTIEVSYKKIPFEIIVKDTNNVVITPKGTISVLYGDSQEFTIIANSGYRLKKVLVNNIDRIKDIKDNKLVISNITKDTTIEVIVEEISYNVIEKDNTIRKNTSAKFRIDADYSLFNNNVFVDDVLLDEKYYTTQEGSTIIILKKEYINILSIGTHTLKVTFSDGGKTTTEFEILEASPDNINNNPNTGDNIKTYLLIFLASLTGSIYVGKKYLNKKAS